ncbi:MAG: fluoride efflux transporter CrcB [Puia sp.]|nr:fluoride efflux transporter CrcB [Puia sp.]
MKHLLIIGLGGGIGSILRYLLQIGVGRFTPVSFPWGTFLVNVSGCFAIGLLYGLSERHSWMTTDWRLFLITGLCGGFTTFSSFSYENMMLLRQGSYVYFLLYAMLSVLLGLSSTVAGAALMK